MQSAWLNKQNNDKLIVFFNGWANDENHLKRLSCDGFDVVVLYDFTSLDFDFNEINSYKNQYVIAWSMGVWVFSQLQGKFENIVLKMAINGTVKPINDVFGIPFKIFEATLNNFTQETREKFYKRMFTSRDDFQKYIEMAPKRSADNQKSELTSLQEQVLDLKDVETKFDKVVVSKKDLIIPTKNQENFYSTLEGVKVVEGGHYPFFNWNSFEEIINDNN